MRSVEQQINDSIQRGRAKTRRRDDPLYPLQCAALFCAAMLLAVFLLTDSRATWTERANAVCAERGGVQQIHEPRVVCRNGLVYAP